MSVLRFVWRLLRALLFVIALVVFVISLPVLWSVGCVLAAFLAGWVALALV